MITKESAHISMQHVNPPNVKPRHRKLLLYRTPGSSTTQHSSGVAPAIERKPVDSRLSGFPDGEMALAYKIPISYLNKVYQGLSSIAKDGAKDVF